MNKIINEENTLKYIKLKFPELKINNRSKRVMFQCPFKCSDSESTHFIPGTDGKIHCTACDRTFNLLDIIKEGLPFLTDTQAEQEVINELKLEVTTESQTDYLLELYKNYNWDLIPLIKNSKLPIEKGYQNIIHKDIEEWKEWLYSRELNIAVKCGEKSNLTVIDVDMPWEEAPEIFKNIETLMENTRRGRHLFFLYETDLPNKDFRLTSGESIEVISDRKHCTIAPSVTDDFARKLVNECNIIKMPTKLKDWLLERYGKIKDTDVEVSEIEVEDISKYIKKMPSNSGRNNSLVHIGGILVKEGLSIKDTATVLRLANYKFFEKPLPLDELKALLGSLDNYLVIDEKELAVKIYNHLRLVEFSTAMELAQSLKQEKGAIEKACSYLIKEEHIFKRGRSYRIIPKIEWQDTLLDNSQQLNFKVPYFGDIANLCWQDHVLIGGEPKIGKTSLSMNIIKRLVEQGIKPKYYTSESGSRFKRTALSLGLRDGDFEYAPFGDPSSLMFEANSVYICDWLTFRDFTQASNILEELKNKLVMANSFAFFIVQLKAGGEWFSPNLIKQYPALAARYFYDDDKGVTGYFQLDAIRDPKMQIKEWKVPCKFIWETKQLIEITPDDIRND